MTLSLVRNIKKSEFQSGQMLELCGGSGSYPTVVQRWGGPYKYFFNVKLFWATSKDHVPPYHCFCSTFSHHLLTNGWMKHLQTMHHLGISLHSFSITSLHINSLTFCLAWSTLFPHPGYWTTTCDNSKSKYWYHQIPWEHTLNDLHNLHPDPDHPSGLNQHKWFNAWKFLSDLYNYSPEYFWKFKMSLGQPKWVEKIPVMKMCSAPACSLNINQSKCLGICKPQ